MNLINLNKKKTTKTEKLASGLDNVATKPKSNNANGVGGTNAAPNGIPTNNTSKNSYKKPPEYDSETGTYAVRQSLEKADIGNIGWDGENVISNGVKLKPSVNRDGTTYAPKADVQDFISRSYSAVGNPLVRANAYNNKYGLSGMLDYDAANKKVTVDGNEVDYAYIDDEGNAWVPEKSMDAAYKAAAERRSITTGDDLMASYKEEIARAREKKKEIADSVKKYSFSFDKLKKDPVYKAYSKMYQREARRAFNNKISEIAGRNGGNMSSAALMQAGQMQNNYLERLNDAVPQIAKMAYERFLTGAQLDYNNQESIAQDAYRIYSAAYNTNRDRITDANELSKDSKNRFFLDEQLDALRQTNRFNKENNTLSLEKGKQSIEATAQSMEAAKKSEALELSKALGYYTDDAAEILGVRKEKNGKYPSVNYAEINKQLELYEKVLKPQYMMERSHQRDDYDYKLEREYKMSIINAAMKKTGKVSKGGSIDEAYKWAIGVLG